MKFEHLGNPTVLGRGEKNLDAIDLETWASVQEGEDWSAEWETWGWREVGVHIDSPLLPWEYLNRSDIYLDHKLLCLFSL